jgi:hypothetical protein
MSSEERLATAFRQALWLSNDEPVAGLAYMQHPK